MIKEITVAQCDICGFSEPAKAVTVQYNETAYMLPKGWAQSVIDAHISFCPKCSELLTRDGKIKIWKGPNNGED